MQKVVKFLNFFLDLTNLPYVHQFNLGGSTTPTKKILKLLYFWKEKYYFQFEE